MGFREREGVGKQAKYCQEEANGENGERVQEGVQAQNKSEPSDFLYRKWNAQEITDPLPFKFLMRVKVSCKKLLAKVVP